MPTQCVGASPARSTLTTFIGRWKRSVETSKNRVHDHTRASLRACFGNQTPSMYPDRQWARAVSERASRSASQFCIAHSMFVCLFVWLNKTRTVKPLRRFHSWSLSFTQDGLAFSTKTVRRALQVQLRPKLNKAFFLPSQVFSIKKVFSQPL